MNFKKRAELIKICISALCFGALLTCEWLGIFLSAGSAGQWIKLGLYVALFLYVGLGVIIKAIKSVCAGHVFGENMLMSIATICAFFVGEYHEAAAVMLFYLVGEWFQGYAVGRARQSVSDLMRLRQDHARVLRDGKEVVVNPKKVMVGEVIVVYPGERIPIDGIIVSGNSSIDLSSLSGEAIPSDVIEGDDVMSGSVNLNATLKIRTTKLQRDSTAARILALVAGAGEKKSRAEAFITRFARWYTPAVIALSVALFVLGGVISGDYSEWGYRALNFLVVSCPCALVVSVPLAFFAGIGRASRDGILIKGAAYVEALSKVDTIVFDKTGTLTEGRFSIVAVYPEARREEVLRLAAIAERNSSHPIAKSIVDAYGREVEGNYFVTNLGGMGVLATGDSVIMCGSNKLMEQYGIAVLAVDEKCVIHVAEDGKYVGTIAMTDRVKDDAPCVIERLRVDGVNSVMFTGDNAAVAQRVARQIGITKVSAGLLPDEKLVELEGVIHSSAGRGTVCFVGDGINDAPSLMRADVGISMGGIGSDAAIEASDVVIMRDDLNKINVARKISTRTMGVVRQNVVFCLLVKGLALGLSALGITGLWFSVFADVGVAVLAILNSVRLLKSANIGK